MASLFGALKFLTKIPMSDLSKTLRTVYMYLVALISVVVFVIGAVNLINTALKAWVFPTSGDYYMEDPVMTCNSQMAMDKESSLINYGSFNFETKEECIAYYEERNEVQAVNQRNNDIAFGISMTVVSLPIWLLHIWFIRKDMREEG